MREKEREKAPQEQGEGAKEEAEAGSLQSGESDLGLHPTPQDHDLGEGGCLTD